MCYLNEIQPYFTTMYILFSFLVVADDYSLLLRCSSKRLLKQKWREPVHTVSSICRNTPTASSFHCNMYQHTLFQWRTCIFISLLEKSLLSLPTPCWAKLCSSTWGVKRLRPCQSKKKLHALDLQSNSFPDVSLLHCKILLVNLTLKKNMQTDGLNLFIYLFILK